MIFVFEFGFEGLRGGAWRVLVYFCRFFYFMMFFFVCCIFGFNVFLVWFVF